MDEIWKSIKGYEGLYEISNLGRIKSFHQDKINGKIIKTFIDEKDGYVRLRLRKNKKEKSFLVHRLVADAFLNNKNNFSQINHKDENKQNNCVDNLEWCNQSYNIRYSFAKPVNQLDKNTKEIIMIHACAKDAAAFLGSNHPSSITECCKGKRKTFYNYCWEYNTKK